MSVVAVLDHRLCNIDSLTRALAELGAAPRVARTRGDLDGATHIVLPGVGAFPAAMRNLRDAGLVDALRARVAAGPIPVLGICLGMQLLAARGTEHESVEGLDLIPGEVRRLTPTAGERVPHIGWNAVRAVPGARLFDGVPPDSDFYFVHSYHFAEAGDAVAATTPYCGGIVSAIQRGMVFGTQFHPEKSQRAGRRVLKNFLDIDSGGC